MAVFARAIFGEDNFELTTDIGVNNAGYTIIKTMDIVTERPAGRKDYQLIYVNSGKVFFEFDGEKTTLECGNVVLYRPGEVQLYEMHGVDKPEIFWIHFSGTKIPELLKKTGIYDKQFFTIKNGVKIIDNIGKIINELQNRHPMFEERINSLFVLILVGICRDLSIYDESDAVIKRARIYIEENYYQDISNADYAEKLGVSESYFMKQFKKYMRVSAQQYRTECRIKNAKNMLISTNYKIADISRIVGYNDSLYFSRVFKKMTDMTPTEYRENFKESLSKI